MSDRIDVVLCTDPARVQAWVELRAGGFVFAEVWYEPKREAYVSRFFDGPDRGLDLPKVRRALSDAQQLLVLRGDPVLPE
jgi:hypothetical protein